MLQQKDSTNEQLGVELLNAFKTAMVCEYQRKSWAFGPCVRKQPAVERAIKLIEQNSL